MRRKIMKMNNLKYFGKFRVFTKKCKNKKNAYFVQFLGKIILKHISRCA